MSYGPLELLVVKFPSSERKTGIAAALADLVESGTIRVIDLVFVQKYPDGSITVAEFGELDDEEYSALDPVVGEVSGLLSEEDIAELAMLLDNDTSAGLMLFENVWATEFRDALLRANGELVLNERIPHAVVEEVLSQRA
jgi:hypothetical protein